MKSLSLIIVFSLLVSILSGGVHKTATMDSILIEELREAVDSDDINDDEVMDFYYDKINPYSPKYEEGEDDWGKTKASYKLIDGASYFAQNALLGAVDVEIGNHSDEFLTWGKRYLLVPLFYISDKYRYLDLDSVWVEFEGGSTGNCLTLGSLMEHVAFIVDMLWYYVDSAEQDSLNNKLDNMAYYANHMLSDSLLTDSYYTQGGWVIKNDSLPAYYPDSLQIYWNNARIRLAGALGYAGCVHI